MHSDDKQGDDHKHEDTYVTEQKIKEVQGKTSGPCEGMDCLHGVMMHGDDKPGQEHKHEKLGPEEKPQSDGPCVGMDCMHGVMMHGDDHIGKDHEKDHEKEKQKQEAEKNNKHADGPCVGMDCMHGVMMHGDEKEGVKHDIEDAEVVKHAHGDHGVKSGSEGKAGPCEGMDCLHGVLMHNDEDQGAPHNHLKAGPVVEAKESGPCVGMDCLHGVMMHGDEKPGKAHAADHEKLHDKPDTERGPAGPEDISTLHQKLKTKEKGKPSAGFLQKFFGWFGELKHKIFPSGSRMHQQPRQANKKKPKAKSQETKQHKHDMRHELDPIGNTAPIHEHSSHDTLERIKKANSGMEKDIIIQMKCN